MENSRIILLGGGGHARVVLDCLQESGHTVSAIFDDQVNTGKLLNVPYMGNYNAGAEKGAKAIVAVGDNIVRKRLASVCAHQFTNAIHKSAIISPNALVGQGCMILHRAIVQVNTVIGDHVILNTGSQVDHDCKIGDFVHLAPGAVLCGTVSVGAGVLIGAGAIVLPGIKIGAGATVGAGAIVRSDVAENAVVAGNPARTIR